jgi:hypothetical protein
MATITVTRIGESNFQVEVREGAIATIHHVTATPADVQRYGGSIAAERLIKASFEFLLEREPKESILSAFALPVIERYFPEYPKEIRKRLV